VHIIHQFSSDFYGAELRAVLMGYMRTMDGLKISSVDELIALIKDDIQFALAKLTPESKAECKKFF
jgi:FAD synthase